MVVKYINSFESNKFQSHQCNPSNPSNQPGVVAAPNRLPAGLGAPKRVLLMGVWLVRPAKDGANKEAVVAAWAPNPGVGVGGVVIGG